MSTEKKIAQVDETTMQALAQLTQVMNNIDENSPKAKENEEYMTDIEGRQIKWSRSKRDKK